MVTSESIVQAQRALTKCALSVLPGFALAGSGAIREHGIINRPTQDVDIFSTLDEVSSPADFTKAIANLRSALDEAGYDIIEHKATDYYCNLVVSKDGIALQMDLGLDFRAQPLTNLSIGPVLSLEDAIASKVAALYSRGEARDFLDVDTIRRKTEYSDDELLRLAAEFDAGFDEERFAMALDAAQRIDPKEVEAYDYTPSDLDAVKQRFQSWKDQLSDC